MQQNLPFFPIKQAAREAVSNNKHAIFTVLGASISITAMCNILFSIMGAVNTTTELYSITYVLISLFITLVSAPISMGLYAVITNALNKKPATVFTALDFYADGQKLKASVLGHLYYSLLAFGWILLFVLPVSFLALIHPTIYLIGLFILGFIAIVIILSRMPGLFILARAPDTSVLQAFRIAKELMKPFVWNFFLLALSYFVFIVLLTVVLVFLLPIPIIGLVAQVASWVISAYISMRMHATMIAYFQQVESLSEPKDTNI